MIALTILGWTFIVAGFVVSAAFGLWAFRNPPRDFLGIPGTASTTGDARSSTRPDTGP